VGAALSTAVTHYKAAPTGNDTNDCLSLSTPCLTIQHAIDLCALGVVCSIDLADGAYSTTVGYNLYYYRFINVTGNCANHAAVTVQIAANSKVLWTIQDHAVGTINCMTMTTNGTGNTVIQGRQLGIVDLDNVDIGSGFVSGTLIVSTGLSSVNCGGTLNIVAQPGYAAMMQASQNSLLTFACATTIQVAGGSTGTTISADGKSYVSLGGASFSGAGAGTGTFGSQCSIQDATLNKAGLTIPGVAGTCSASPTPDAATGAGFIQ
jgi:hypothetical protein